MAKDKKEGIPDHILKYQKLSKKAREMITTMERHHRTAYDAAADTVLVDKDTGQIDMEKLEDMKVREQFAEKMADNYLSKAKQVFKVKEGKEGLTVMEQELLMNAYAGATKAQLLQHVKQKGKGFTFDHFYGELRPKMMENITDNLSAATVSHFNDKHIGDIVKHTKTEGIFDSGKMRLQEALGILSQYEQVGVVPEKQYREALFYKKKKKAA